MPIFSAQGRFCGGWTKLSIALLFSATTVQYCGAQPSRTSNSETPEQLLRHGLHLGELYSWTDAATDFEQAEKGFAARGDKRDALYAHIGLIRATALQRNLLRTSAELDNLLEHDSFLESDNEVRLLCLIVKGDIDQEIDSRAALLDWEQVKGLAAAMRNKVWTNRALGQIGISAFYAGDLATARTNVASALAMAKQINDVGAEIRFTTVLGMALVEAKMYEQALPYFDNALAIARKTPEISYPIFTNTGRVQALIGLKRYDQAQQSINDLLKQTGSKYGAPERADLLRYAAQIALARSEVQASITDLQESVMICRRARGYPQLQAESYGMLAGIFRRTGNIQKAVYYAEEAAASARSSGNKWSLPARLQTLADLQIFEGKYAESERTLEKASAFVDSALANSSTVLEKTALINASGNLYPDQISLLVDHLHDPAKAYSVIEQVRGRVATDLLISGATNSAAAKRIERTISGLQLQMMSATSAVDVQRLRDQIFTVQEGRWIAPGVSILNGKLTRLFS
ncbi:MAG: tetratricopeptide repeat protein, partial [Acidobacteriota bacterium]|nr:tetratricopeptide repeat protein [Acidobacteriota bacterium]